MRDSPEVTARDEHHRTTPPVPAPPVGEPPSPPPEPTVPYPPRFRWLRRMTLLTLAVVALLVAARGWWAHEADRRLRAEMAAARARGEPTLPEDFDPAPIPDAENAAPIYLQAINAISLTQAQQEFLRDLDDVPLKAGDAATADQILSKSDNMLRLARLAGERPRASWQNMAFRSPVFWMRASTDTHSLRRLLLLAEARATARNDQWQPSRCGTTRRGSLPDCGR